MEFMLATGSRPLGKENLFMSFRETIATLRQSHPELQAAGIAVTAMAISYYILPRVKKISTTKGLHALVNHRSSHADPVSNLGGVPIMAALLLTTLSLNNLFESPRLQYVMAAMFLLFLIGIYDDIHILTPKRKLLGQFLAATLIVVGGNLVITSFYGLFGIQAIPEWVGIPFTIVAIIGIINSINMIDGVDGLCGGLAIISLMFFAFWAMGNGVYQAWALISLAYIGALLPFMRFNLFHAIGRRKRIFLGDNGSLPLGGLLASWAVLFCEAYAKTHEPTLEPQFGFAPLVALAALFIPVSDTIRIMILRLLKGRSPFHADKEHLHHLWLRLGLSHFQISLILWGCQMVILALAVSFSPRFSFPVTISVLLAYAIIIYSLPVILGKMIKKDEPPVLKTTLIEK
jgi:UDP-N-acetylmuramyl pentapeptide phosphotransferase/UDP-N-acetylglucosamine-1-phosphate transferase